jgi:hypothetical protein
MDERPSMFDYQEEAPDELQGLAMNPRTYLASRNGTTFASLPFKGAAATDKYWKDGTMVMETYTHNGETISLPVIARTFETIETHAGGNKINWAWKVQVLINHFKTVSTSSTNVLINYDIAGINNFKTTAYLYTDCNLHPENLHHDLSKGNAGDVDIPADSRHNVCWFSMTQHFQPRQVISAGNMIDVNLLPAPSSQRVFLRAQRDGNDDLINAITKNMIDNYPQQIINMTPDPTFVLAAPGGYPDENRHKQWLLDLKNKTKFYALKQILQKHYIGKAFSTENACQPVL